MINSEVRFSISVVSAIFLAFSSTTRADRAVTVSLRAFACSSVSVAMGRSEFAGEEIDDAFANDLLDFFLQRSLEGVTLNTGVVQEEVEPLDVGILIVV